MISIFRKATYISFLTYKTILFNKSRFLVYNIEKYSIDFCKILDFFSTTLFNNFFCFLFLKIINIFNIYLFFCYFIYFYIKIVLKIILILNSYNEIFPIKKKSRFPFTTSVHLLVLTSSDSNNLFNLLSMHVSTWFAFRLFTNLHPGPQLPSIYKKNNTTSISLKYKCPICSKNFSSIKIQVQF